MGLAHMASEARDIRHGPLEAKIQANAFDCWEEEEDEEQEEEDGEKGL